MMDDLFLNGKKIMITLNSLSANKENIAVIYEKETALLIQVF